jgi:hypothetical protein
MIDITAAKIGRSMKKRDSMAALLQRVDAAEAGAAAGALAASAACAGCGATGAPGRS